VHDWFAAADVVVQPSRWEGMSLTVLEAMASGRSVVATNLPSMAQALGPGGETALVPVNDPVALATALVRRLGNPSLRCAEESRNRFRAQREFDLASWTNRLVLVSESLLR
jgi:glycosyltransferase involved in cell wall biosynthesis